MKYRCARCSAIHPSEVPGECPCGNRSFETVSEAASVNPLLATHPANPKPLEVGGTHYQEGVKTSPWDLQRAMQSSGNAFVDSRRADAIKYAFRMKGDLKKLAEDLRKAADCAIAGAKEIEAGLAEIASSIKSKIEKDPPAWATHKSSGWNGVITHSFKTPLGTYEAKMHTAQTFECWRVYLDGVELETGKSYQTCGEAARACELHFEMLKTPSSI